MKRSKRVALSFLGSMAISIGPIVASCGGTPSAQALHCVDSTNIVVEDNSCQVGTPGPGGAGVGRYHWYYGGHSLTGSRVSGGSEAPASGASYKSSSGTVR